jgi:hypothetical protein
VYHDKEDDLQNNCEERQGVSTFHFASVHRYSKCLFRGRQPRVLSIYTIRVYPKFIGKIFGYTLNSPVLCVIEE